VTHVIRQMGHVTFSTPDPEGSARDLVDLVGLKITDRRDGAVYLSSNERRFEVAFVHGDKRGVLAVGVEAMDAAALAEVRRRVLSDGLGFYAAD
jgi:catechol 2,3-dioxygenase